MARSTPRQRQGINTTVASQSQWLISRWTLLTSEGSGWMQKEGLNGFRHLIKRTFHCRQRCRITELDAERPRASVEMKVHVPLRALESLHVGN